LYPDFCIHGARSASEQARHTYLRRANDALAAAQLLLSSGPNE